jgi:hypothetical protein
MRSDPTSFLDLVLEQVDSEQILRSGAIPQEGEQGLSCCTADVENSLIG